MLSYTKNGFSYLFFSTLNRAPLRFFAPGPLFCKAITASLHSSQKNKKPKKVFDANYTKKSRSDNPESQRSALIFSNLYLLDLHDIIIYFTNFITEKRISEKRALLCFFYSNVTSVSRWARNK